MKQRLFLAVLLLIGSTMQAKVLLSGTISKYKISMQLEASTGEHGIQGKYNYAGKTSYLDIVGDYYYGGCMQLTESYGGKETGTFYLETDDQGSVVGKWIGNGKIFDVKLTQDAGDIDEFATYDLDEKQRACSPGKTGTYVVVSHWLNDYFLSEDSPEMEIGFNGGVMTIKENGKDAIDFSFEMICGPTYHFAVASGTAKRVSANEFHFKEVMQEGEAPCELHFVFGDKTVDLAQHSDNFVCGFGARAYADGSFTKVKDQVVSSDEGLSIQDALK